MDRLVGHRMTANRAGAHAQRQPRLYRSWTTDSRRWAHYRPRDGDVIIATYPKCGTTWMQRIVDLLVFQSPEPRSINEVSPWIDRSISPIESVMEQIEKQAHRRFLKSHLPFDGLPYFEAVRYIHVARDGRDACMSYFNHCSAYTASMYAALDQAAAEDMRAPAPRCPDDVRIFWHDWLTRGIEPGSDDGFPGLSFFDFENTWWRARSRENVLLVHYNDLKEELEGEMRRIAAFLSIDVEEGSWAPIVRAATFEEMKRDGEALLPQLGTLIEGGSQRFLYKGSNGRWREVISAAELALYENKAASRFTRGLASWIEGGRVKAGDPRVASD